VALVALPALVLSWKDPRERSRSAAPDPPRRDGEALQGSS